MVHDLKFGPSFRSFVDTSFFHELSRLKLEVFKLDSDEVELYSVLDLGNITSAVAPLSLRGESFNFQSKPDSLVLAGTLLNFNTIESFKRLDKIQYIKDKGNELYRKGLQSGLNACVRFYVISFADLKKYKYYYWVCMPSFQKERTTFEVIETRHISDENKPELKAFKSLVMCLVNGSLENATPVNLKSCHKVVFRDLSRLEDTPASVTRNILTVWNQISERPSYTISFLRDDNSSFEITVQLKNLDNVENEVLKVSGWERNGLGKLGPKSTDLSSLLDPVKLADQAIDLNLKLMKWRIAPEIELDRIRNVKALLLGSGTLGCYVARALLAWGTRHITFVDNSTVSFSNPVRQPLYNFEDCGRLKSEAASDSLKRIFPLVDSSGYQLDIPMIGHPVSNEPKQKVDYETLETLIKSHDVIFLMMDARETRWLPSVLGRLHKKIVINAALGFDSYLVMRHGNEEDNLGCYFCNDVVAPSDSLTDRTLDQMCTVTRPGVALLAASQAVELLVSYLQPSERALGHSPHQIRGFLNEFKTVKLETPMFKHCCACNADVINTLRHNGWNFVKQALDDYTCVEQLSGLTKIQDEAESALLADVDFSEDDEFLIE